jgi:hypothetical protein
MDMRPPPFEGFPPPLGGNFDVPGLPGMGSPELPQVPMASLGGQPPAEGGSGQVPDITAPADRAPLVPVEAAGAAAVRDAVDVPGPAEYAEAPTEVPSHPVVEMLDNIHAEEVLGNPETREQLRREIDTDTALSHLNHVNALVRDMPPAEHEMDGMSGMYAFNERGQLGPDKTYDPPAAEDRPGLLAEAIEASRTLEAEHGATLSGLAINATHAWGNGNGRTARFAYTVQTHGYDGSPADRQLYNAILTETEGRQIVDPNPAKAQLPQKYVERTLEADAESNGYTGAQPGRTIGGYDTMIKENYTPGNISTDPSVSQLDRQILYEVVTDPVFAPNSLFRFVLENRDAPDLYVDEGWEEGQPASIDLDALIPELSSDDIHTIADMHSEIKRGYVRDLIDTFTNPARRQEAQALVDFYRPVRRS